jgi:hypothetical protein
MNKSNQMNKIKGSNESNKMNKTNQMNKFKGSNQMNKTNQMMNKIKG